MDILTRLKRALTEGAALAALGLAGCSAPVIPSLDSGQMVAEDAGGLPQHDGGLGCFGPVYDGGYHGQCCNSLRCRECSAGPMLPPGSGTCSCGPTPGFTGPFAAEDGGSDCCWVVGSIYCDGRPLLVEGEPVTAPVVSRSDWA